MKYLVDTNVWLSLFLEQENSKTAFEFFDLINVDELAISDFSFHSIGVILTKYKKYFDFRKFIDDLFINAHIKILYLKYPDMLRVLEIIKHSELDFDDAYQLSVAEKFGLTIITFDNDFNVPGIIKKSPYEIVSEFSKQS